MNPADRVWQTLTASLAELEATDPAVATAAARYRAAIDRVLKTAGKPEMPERCPECNALVRFSLVTSIDPPLVRNVRCGHQFPVTPEAATWLQERASGGNGIELVNRRRHDRRD